MGLLELIFDVQEKVKNKTKQTAASEASGSAEIVVDKSSFSAEGGYRDTLLPFFGDNSGMLSRHFTPDRLRKMRRLFVYSSQSRKEKARNFVKQARFMEDYEDDAPWSGDFHCYFPCYQDMTTKQLRGYFSWRTRVRKGEFTPISTSAAYVYVYELLNGVGVSSPDESLQKLAAFDKGYLQSGMGDPKMRLHLWNWMFELAVVNGLPAETVRQFMSPKLLEEDKALAALMRPEKFTDEEVFRALSEVAGKRFLKSRILSTDEERAKHLFAACWRMGMALSGEQETDLFTLCFGQRVFRDWFPFRNALYCPEALGGDRDYVLNECRSYHCRNGFWQELLVDRKGTDAGKLRGFLREAERKLRQYLKTGGSLKAAPEDAWADPFIDAAIEEDRKAVREASRPKITIDFSRLDRIRREAVITRNSLLPEEERALMEGVKKHEDALKEKTQDVFDENSQQADIPADTQPLNETTVEPPSDTLSREAAAGDTAADIPPLDSILLQILCILLKGESVKGLIRTNHLMPSVVADNINEALYEEIGDTVILCEEDELSLVEDYLEDLRQLPGLRELL